MPLAITKILAKMEGLPVPGQALDQAAKGLGIEMHHYTDKAGFNSIRATVVWRFKASQPPGDHPFGAYFTTLGPAAKNLALKLRIPNAKTEYVFIFGDAGDLIPLRGQRGDYIFYSPKDYLVEESRKIAMGERAGIANGSGVEE